MRKLREYVHMILPLVYDESLSYYEVLSKLIHKVNEIVDHVNKIVVPVFTASAKYGDTLSAETVQTETGYDIEFTFPEGADGSKIFNTVQEVLENNLLSVGDTVKTLGYYEPGDGGECILTVVSEPDGKYFNIAYGENYLQLNNPNNAKQFGAYGDNIHDDSDALINLFNYAQDAFVPEGYYKISKTIYIRRENRSDIRLSGKAMLIFTGAASNYTNGILVDLYSGLGYNPLGISWSGGVINMNGIPNVTGVYLGPNSGDFTYIERMFIYDVGNNSVGFYMNKRTGKALIEQMVISSAMIVYDSNDRDSSWSWSFDRDGENRLLRNTIGYKNNAWDYTIQNLMTFGTTIGVYSEAGSEVSCDNFWAISEVAGSTKITFEQYKKTIAFKGETDSRWAIGHFFPDDYYIAVDGGAIQCENTHLITCLASYVSDLPAGEEVLSYLCRPRLNNAYMEFGKLTINHQGKFAGVLYDQIQGNSALYRGLVKATIFPNELARFPASTCAKLNGRSLFSVSTPYQANTKYFLGYVVKQISGHGKIYVSSLNHRINFEFDVYNYDQNCVVANAKYYHKQSNLGDCYVGVCAQEIIDGGQIAVYALYFETDTAFNDTLCITYNDYDGFVGGGSSLTTDATSTQRLLIEPFNP